jgi:GntR family transcriptional regulator, rspAB operon transcriptional repressor
MTEDRHNSDSAISGRRSDSVFEGLLAEIVKVARRPGEPLNKDDIAAELGVSRQPVTDAINRLATLGLVTIIPQVNSYVSRISPADVIESSFIRSAVEAQVVHELASHPRKEIVEQLRHQLAIQVKLVAASDVDGFHEADDAFHRQLSELAGLPGLWDQIAAARLHLVRVRRLGLPRPGRLAISYAEHSMIVDEIEAGRPRKAANTIAQHIRYNEGELRRLQKDLPQYFL